MPPCRAPQPWTSRTAAALSATSWALGGRARFRLDHLDAHTTDEELMRSRVAMSRFGRSVAARPRTGAAPMCFASRPRELNRAGGYRRSFVTRQVSGWRFVMRRIASGVALHDPDARWTRCGPVPGGVDGALLLLSRGCWAASSSRSSGPAPPPATTRCSPTATPPRCTCGSMTNYTRCST